MKERSLKKSSLKALNFFDEFCLYKKASGISERTLSDYKMIQKILDDCELTEIQRHVIKYFANLNVNAVTFNTRLKLLKTYCNWLVSEKIITENPITIKKRKEDTKPRAVALDDIKKILNCCNKDTWSGLRDGSCRVSD